jgi:hypothetical protein
MRRLGVIVALLLAASCARHVVLDPEQAAALDNKVWTIVSEPDASTAPPPRPLPAADAGP